MVEPIIAEFETSSVGPFKILPFWFTKKKQTDFKKYPWTVWHQINFPLKHPYIHAAPPPSPPSHFYERRHRLVAPLLFLQVTELFLKGFFICKAEISFGVRVNGWEGSRSCLYRHRGKGWVVIQWDTVYRRTRAKPWRRKRKTERPAKDNKLKGSLKW